ncbi:MAG TPA: FliA/WhiG family RNA polymerase sigma factor [Solirubrobacteraceae bacterium]|nr:FliA/WhiG family RNA polymerase sigma factor [Solirubrobacteraceae bacterium]
MRVKDDQTLVLWRAYRESGDPELRNRLVLTLAPLVKYIVGRKVRELPPQVEASDFISCGIEALIAAIDRFDPARGASLEQYVWTRIHGAVLDELRRLDWAPRSVRRTEREYLRAREEFAVVHRRAPTEEESAAMMGMSVEDFRAHELDVILGDVGSLNVTIHTEREGAIERIEAVPDPRGDSDPERCAQRADAHERLRRAFAQLDERERTVAVLLYVEELTLREIGEVVGLSESRVCQIHHGLRRRLREKLSADEPLFLTAAA